MNPWSLLSRERLEPLLRHLGCGCPSEVFRQVRTRPEFCPPFEAAAVVGGRLLVAVSRNASPELLEHGRLIRDTEGLNRFRLLVLGPRPAALPSWLDGLPDRIHCHWLEDASY